MSWRWEPQFQLSASISTSLMNISIDAISRIREMSKFSRSIRNTAMYSYERASFFLIGANAWRSANQ
jgi:hypothetical protein